MGKVIGIDLGTTNSCVAYIEDGRPVVIADRDGKRTTPSIYAISSSQEPLVGYQAKRQAETNRLNTIFAVKRLIGRKFTSDEVLEASEKLPYRIVAADNGDAWVEVNGKPTSPEEVSANILIKMKEVAEEYLGEPIGHAVVTVPAYFNDAQRQATKDAGKVAGLDVLRIINEPTAAALAYGLDLMESRAKEATHTNGTAPQLNGATAAKDEGLLFAVFDLGGGTFDITILTLKDGVFDVKSTNGDTFLGGEDFDLALVNYLLQEFKRTEGIDLSEDKMVLQRLKDAAQQAKHDLSTEVQVQIKIPFIAKGEGNASPKHLDITLERKTLEKLVGPLLQRLEEPCYQAMEDAKIKPEQLNEVILVGGMTRMPSVKKRCMQIFGREPNDTVDPDEAVAVGAAIQAGLLQGFIKGVSLLDVTSLSLGIETQGGTSTVLIPRNTKIPTTVTEIFTTSAPNQPQVSIHVLQGESQFAPDNKTLGRFELMGVRPAPRGVPKIAVTFDIDVEGIVHVSAKDLDTGEEKTIEIIASSGLSDREIDELLKEHRHNATEEARRDDLTETRNALMSYIFQTQFKLDTEALGFKGAARQMLETSIHDARMTLGTSSDPAALKVALAQVQEAVGPMERFIQNM